MRRALKLLGLSGRPSLTDIRNAYRKLAHQLHPDKNHDKTATDQFIALQRAYETALTKYDEPRNLNPFGLHHEDALQKGGIWFGQ